MRYLLKIDRLGGKADIRGMGLAQGAERIARLEITAKDYISISSLPLKIAMSSSGVEDRSDLTTKLQHVFISTSRIQDLASEFKLLIIQKLIPGLNKEGYEESPSTKEQTRQGGGEDHRQRRTPPSNPLADPGPPRPARPYPFGDPLAVQPRRPLPEGEFAPPGFDDEYDINRPPGGAMPPYLGGRSPFNIGHDDLNPPGLGPLDPY